MDGETPLQKARICNHDSTVNYLLSVLQVCMCTLHMYCENLLFALPCLTFSRSKNKGQTSAQHAPAAYATPASNPSQRQPSTQQSYSTSGARPPTHTTHQPPHAYPPSHTTPTGVPAAMPEMRREQAALVVCGEEILGIVDFDKDATLAQVRKQLRGKTLHKNPFLCLFTAYI